MPVVEAGSVLGILSIRDTPAKCLRESEFEINVPRDVAVAVRHH